MTCTICEHRPARIKGICPHCADGISKMSRRVPQPQHFLTYRGHVVGLYPSGGSILKPRLLARNAEKLPKGKTIDLNHFCKGFSRTQVKKFKACILQLANA